MKRRREDKPLAEACLEISRYEGVQMRREVAEPDICAVLQVLGLAAGRTLEAYAEGDTPAVVKTIACLHIDGVGAFERFYGTRIHAGEEFMMCVGEDLFDGWLLMEGFGLLITDSDKGQEVAYLVVLKGGDETQLVERDERVFVGVEEDVVYLAGGEEAQLGELLVRGVVEVDRGVMKGVEIRLELLVIDFGELRRGAVDIEDDVVNALPEDRQSTKGPSTKYEEYEKPFMHGL